MIAAAAAFLLRTEPVNTVIVSVDDFHSSM